MRLVLLLLLGSCQNPDPKDTPEDSAHDSPVDTHGDSDSPVDTHGDSDSPVDTHGDSDSPVDTVDTGDTSDTGDTGEIAVPLDGFGTITGTCGAVDLDLLYDTDPSYLENVLDFGDLTIDLDALTDGGREVYEDGNLGGSSIYSEVFSFEVLARCELAELLKTEGEISYDVEGTKTDILVEIEALKVGVSVTRAYAWPPDEPYTVEQAYDLLHDKLTDIHASTANVSDEDAWVKQILHVMAYTPDHAESLRAAFDTLDEDTLGDTIVYVTVTEGNDEELY